MNENKILLTSVAGGIAGCAAKTIVAPLDRVKILFQTHRPEMTKHSGTFSGIFLAAKSIYSQSGIRGLLQGHSATLVRIYPYASIKFTANEYFKSVLVDNSRNSFLSHFFAGSLAGVCAVAASYPLEMFRVRMAFEMTSHPHKLSYAHIFNQIWTETSPWNLGSKTIIGITNFYRGFAPTIGGMIPYAGVSFATYDACKSSVARLYPPSVAKSGKGRLKAVPELLCGGIAGGVGQTVSYPLEIIRRSMQVAGRIGTPRSSFSQTVRSIYTTQGFSGFWVGLSIGYIKVVPMSAVSFLVFELMKKVLEV